ncbi:MAG TPA: topoisomerase DNA-binding C4 zinc finger domain-containing protein [Aliidiomarina sp.]|nr:topoisomerase DNA-binding C4 zinc finger domain-containing protein [Aliidiomarina sp.]
MSENELFSNSQRHTPEPAEPCPKCGAQLRIRHSGRNSFWGCETYPNCDYTRSVHEQSDFDPQPLPGQHCPDCESELVLKKGRYGFFVGCSAFPKCHYMVDPNAPAEEQAPVCPECEKGRLLQRTSRYGKSFYACDSFPKCRYSLNEEPVAESCPKCGWRVLARHRQHGRDSLRCPQKECGYRSN